MVHTDKTYDTVIIGGGPAGYTSALYSTRSGLETLVIERFSAGGQMTQTQQIDNYPGFEEGIDGFTLGSRMRQSAERFGAQTLNSEVLSADLAAQPKLIKTDSGEIFAKTVIIATGAEHKHLGIESEEKFSGRGVSYCAACDGMLFRSKTVVVVGGGNSAVTDALLLSRICKKVILIHRRDTLRAEQIYRNKISKCKNVEFKWNCTVSELLGTDKITGVKVNSTKTSEAEEVPCDGVFISIGRSPSSDLFKGQLDMDDTGYIAADESTKTNIPGVFAAGDVRTKSLRQIVTAAADGAVAAHFAEEFCEQV